MWLSRAGAQGCCARWGPGKGISITVGKLVDFCSETIIKNINIVCLFHFQKTGTMVWSTIYDTDKVRRENLKCVFYPFLYIPSVYECRKFDLVYRMTFYLHLTSFAKFLVCKSPILCPFD